MCGSEPEFYVLVITIHPINVTAWPATDCDRNGNCMQGTVVTDCYRYLRNNSHAKCPRKRTVAREVEHHKL